MSVCAHSHSESAWFPIEIGVCQGCMLAPDSFTMGVDWLLERTVGTGMNGVCRSISLIMSLDSLSYLNSSYLHLR